MVVVFACSPSDGAEPIGSGGWFQMEQNQVVPVVVFSPSNGAEPSGSGGCFQSFKWSRTKWFWWLLSVLQMEQNQVVRVVAYSPSNGAESSGSRKLG